MDARIRCLLRARDLPAAYCARQFSAWGADVAVVEFCEDSPLRRHPPFIDGRDGKPTSLLWEWIAANKRAVRIDTDTELRELLASADILVTDFDARFLARYGVSLSGLEDSYPGLCVVSVTPFGLSGPYRDFHGTDLVVEALSGYLSLNGLAEREPLRSPGNLTAYAVGVNAFVAALAAWLKRERTGVAERVEVSGMETVASMVPFLQVQYSGRDKVREGGTESGVRLLPCSDGWLSVAVNALASKDSLTDILEIPAEAVPPDLYQGTAEEVIAAGWRVVKIWWRASLATCARVPIGSRFARRIFRPHRFFRALSGLSGWHREPGSSSTRAPTWRSRRAPRVYTCPRMACRPEI